MIWQEELLDWSKTLYNALYDLFVFVILQILVPIANGTEEMEAVMIIDILRRAKATVVVASVEDKLETIASRKVKLEADMLLDEAAKLSYDLIVLPVSYFSCLLLFSRYYIPVD